MPALFLLFHVFVFVYHSCSLTNANIQLSNEVCTARADLKFSRATIKEYANLRQLVNFLDSGVIPFDKTKLHETALHVITSTIQRVLRTYPENEDPFHSLVPYG